MGGGAREEKREKDAPATTTRRCKKPTPPLPKKHYIYSRKRDVVLAALAAERLGDTVNVTLAVTPEYAFLMAGGDPRQRLASLVGPAGKADSEAKPFVGVDVSVSRLMAPVLADFGILPTDSPTAEEDTGNDRKGGDIKLLIRPIDRGVATRLSADAAALKVLAAGAGALEPLGGANPNAFPIPVPAQ